MFNGFYKFQDNIGCECVIEDCISFFIEGGVDLFWIEIVILNVDEIVFMVNVVCEVVLNVKLVYNNSLSFNWILNLCKQVCEQWIEEGKIVEIDYLVDVVLMLVKLDEIEFGIEVDVCLQSFQLDILVCVGVFYNLIILLMFYFIVKGMDELFNGYFGEEKMLVYVKNV